ncbi:MAG: TldD/PmbA family protein [Deltaproteobacteria bacterium]|nr:MAG: TldD/PmbA family protein [Deltaproteobacteria bacterium]
MSARAGDGALEGFDARAEEERLLARVAELCENARRDGADEAEAYGERVETIAVHFEKNDLKLGQVDEGTSVGLRVFREGKQGFSSTNQCDAEALRGTARDALTVAGFSVPDPHNRLLEPRPLDAPPCRVDPALAAMSVPEAVQHGREFLRRALARDPRISIDKASFSVHRDTRAVCSSTGARAVESDASAMAVLFGMAVDGEDVGGFDYWGDGVRDPARLDAMLEESIEHFARSVLGNLGARSAETYRGPVLFAPPAFVDVFVDPLISAASAIAVQRDRSALRGKLGKAIAAAAISIADDPRDAELRGATGFDREGQPARRLTIVERGVLEHFLYNGYAARVDGCDSTGHASGGARAVPGLGPHAVVVAPGSDGDRDALVKALGRGLFIQRFSGTVDPASGDFSGVAKSARWVENGEVVRSLKETLISGNAFELLHRVVALSSESPRVMGSVRAPFAIVDGISVTAG